MPDKNVQLPDGRVVAFPDSMSDDAISAAVQKQLPPTQKPLGSAVAGNMAQVPTDPAHPFASAMAQEGMTDVNEALAKSEFAQQHPWINGIGDFLSTAPFAIAGLAKNLFPSTARATANLGQVAKAVGEVKLRPPAEVSDALYQTLTQIEKSDTGAPPIVKKLEAWLTDPSKGISWQDLRDFQSQLGRRVFLDENKNVIKDAKVLKSVGNLFGAVKDWALDVADQHGALDAFEQGLKEYGRAQGAKQTVSNATKTVAKTATPWLVRGAAGGVGYEAARGAYGLLSEMLGGGNGGR